MLPGIRRVAVHIPWEALERFYRDNTLQVSAALAFYAVFAMAPLLVVAVAAAGAAYGQSAAEGKIVEQIQSTVGAPGAQLIENILRRAYREHDTRIASIVATLVLIVGSTGVFASLQEALNTVWRVQPKPDRAWWLVIRTRLISFLLVLFTGVLLVALLIGSAVLSAIYEWIEPTVPAVGHTWRYAYTGLTFAMTYLLFAAIFKVLPDVVLPWRCIFLGATVAAVLLTLGKWGIGFYLGHSGITSTYGAAGSFMVVMIWAWYSAIVLLYGAHVTEVYSREFNLKVRPRRNSVWMDTKRENRRSVTDLPEREDRGEELVTPGEPTQGAGRTE